MAFEKMGGGGRHGSGHSSKNQKPGYMSHIPAGHLSAHTPHANKEDSMSHSNLMAKCGGGSETGYEDE